MKPARALRLLPYLLLLASSVQASPLPTPGEVTLEADTITASVPSDSYRATGGVRLVQDGTTLLSDSVLYHRRSGDLFAEGKFLLMKERNTLRGERFSLNLESRLGELSNGEIFIQRSNFRVWGERMEKSGDDDYHIEKGSFTTCNGDNPSWRFEAKSVELTLDEFATAHDALFYVGNIPLFYTPYLVFPVSNERQSGLLIPSFGHSSTKGFYLNQPFYFVIDPSKDVTFNLDMESRRGAGMGGGFRYLRPQGSEGRLQWFGIYDTEVEKFRGELDQKHLEMLSPNTTLSSDIHLIADRAYYRDYGELAGDYNRQLLESTASFDHRWERYGLTGQVSYAQDLIAVNNDATLQRLPALGFTAAGEKLGPVFFSMDSSLINFERTVGVTGERLDLHPRLTYYGKPAGPLDLSLYGGYQQRVYNAYGLEPGAQIQQIGEADAGGTVSMPLERVYDARLRHLLIPTLGYGFVQQKQEDNLPFFDWNDRVLGQSALKWSLASVVTGKFAQEVGAPDYRDLLYLKLSQGYQFSGERRDLLTLVDAGHRLTDLMLESTVTPMKGLSILADSRYNQVDGNLSTANLAVEVKGDERAMVHLGYRYSRGELDYLEGSFTFPVTSQYTAGVLERYSFDRGALLESRYSLEYKHQCWSIIAIFANRPAIANAPGNISNPGNTEFTVNFTLAGLGELGPVRAF